SQRWLPLRSFLLLELAQMRLRLLRAFADVRGDAAFLQCVAQLSAQESAGRVAGDSRIETLGESFYHLGIGVEYIGQDGEVVVIDNGVHLPTETAEFRLNQAANAFDVGKRLYGIALEIDEELVLLRVVGEAFFQRQTQQVFPQAHRLGAENARIHEARRFAYDRPEIHLGENVLLQIYAGSDLDQLEPFFVQTEDAALGDVEGRLLAPYRVAAAVGTVLDLLHE